ncbi:MAG: hypothetical protein IKK10_03690 [Clostridia bacterium]|nr:hypothetical protein [Clostridia bacterium]
MIKTPKRITLFAGHYGSGKTNIAVNYALKLKEMGKNVEIADLDIVNPYYRTKDSEEELTKAGIRVISSEFANSNVDFPAMPGEAYSIIDNKDTYAVCDVGGDDRGAYALGRFREGIMAEDYEMYLVINKFRPLTSDVDSLKEIKEEIEAAAGIPFTAIVNNSNLGRETTAEAVLSSLEYAEEAAEKLNLPVKLTAVHESLFDELKDKIENLMPLVLQQRNFW